ncbi:MarR family winged helix-turn-helix transcriptional regulator [Kribbella sp. NPDC049227]|uniref:MarR family winged helix-turn-helix transcriptional regulator n=1 Tax=Kribbella sp. NPDC049227 TaxID=3364113 RepID=UPI0037105259
MREGVTPADPERAAALELVHRLREVALRLELAVGEFARATGLHATDVRALTRLLDAERAGVEATPGWLAQQLGMTSQATTAVIHRLEAAGHVERLRSRSDGRSARLQVSETAVDLGWRFFGPLLERLIGITEQLDQRDRSAVTDYLTTVADALE